MNSIRRPKLVTSRRALFRITESARRELEKLVFQRHPHREWGSFIKIGFRQTNWGVALTYAGTLPPEAGDLDRCSPVVEFQPDYIDRALDWLEKSPLGIGVIHSHPQNAGVYPSPSDDDMDNHFGCEMFLPFAPDRPYASLIVNQTTDGILSFSGRVYLNGEWVAITDVHSSGTLVKQISSELHPQRSRSTSSVSREILSRWLLVADGKIIQRLRGATIGIIGCSGTGSPTVEALARAQVGGFVLIDPKRISLSNLERVHGSCLDDLKNEPPPHKVQLMAKMIKEVNPDAEITLIVGNSLDDLAMNELLRCDMILGCTDTYHGRVHLGDLSSRYLIPCLDVGVLPTGETGRITEQLIDLTRLSPEDPCPFCLGKIDQQALSDELLSPSEVEEAKKCATEAKAKGGNAEAYWRGEPPQLPSVGYLTSAAGNLMAGYALNWLLGTSQMPHNRIQLDLGSPGLGVTFDDEKPSNQCACVRNRGHADQGELSIEQPLHFSRAKIVPELEKSSKESKWRKIMTKIFRRFQKSS